MENFLILSDTHGNLDLLDKVLTRERTIQNIIHLGDNYEDLEKCSFDLSLKKVFRVPGIFHKGYRNKSLPALLKLSSMGWNILLVHDLHDALAKGQDTDIYLHGHTHIPEIAKEYGKIFFNPGHLKQTQHRNNQASYGIIEIAEKSANFSVKDLHNNVIYNRTFNR